MSVFGWQTSLTVPDLWLTGDHFVGKLCALTDSAFHSSRAGKYIDVNYGVGNSRLGLHVWL